MKPIIKDPSANRRGGFALKEVRGYIVARLQVGTMRNSVRKEGVDDGQWYREVV
jgi:hypothetical protein